MARRQKMEVGGLNIRLHPHSEDRYRDFLYALYQLKAVTNIRGDRSGLITSIDRRSNEKTVISGVITTFLEIDMKGEWFNTDTMKEASTNEIEAINIPTHLRPNVKSYRFNFDVTDHSLVFEHYSEQERLTHHSALTFFRNLARNRKLGSEFGDVKISIIQSKGSADRIFAIPRITDLDILIEKPNADLWGGNFEEIAEEHLENKNARSMNVVYKAEAGQGIERDGDLNTLVAASLRNGRTVAKGYGPNGHVRVSTDDYPKVVQDMYEEDLAPSSVFERLSRAFRRR